jgi:hypothetical protein
MLASQRYEVREYGFADQALARWERVGLTHWENEHYRDCCVNHSASRTRFRSACRSRTTIPSGAFRAQRPLSTATVRTRRDAARCPN